jgi:hypothetical protein
VPPSWVPAKLLAADAAAAGMKMEFDDDLLQFQEMSKDQAQRVSDTAWIGGIPENLCEGNIEAVNEAFGGECKQFGKVISATVRVKPGVNKSWALCTFEEPKSASKCVADGMTVLDGDGNAVVLKCKISEVEANLKKDRGGALASMAKKHGEEVECMYAAAMYKQLDYRGLGQLSASALSCRLHDFGLSDHAIETLIFKMDTDYDGIISPAEFELGFAAYKKAVGHV